MNASIKKEVRQLALPFVTTVLLTVVASLVFIGHDAAWLVNDVFAFGCLLIGVTVFGGEFQYRTAASLLAQPVRRQRIWGQKIILLVIALAVSYGVNLLSVQLFVKGEALPESFFEYAFVVTAVPILVLSLAPISALLVKNFIGAMVITAALAGIATLIFAGNTWLAPKMFPQLISETKISFEINPYWRTLELAAIYLWPDVVFCALMYWLGYRIFLRLEVIEGQGQEVALPVKVERILGRAVKWIVPGYTSPTASLVRKEVQLQRAAFIVTGVTVLLLGVEACWWKLLRNDVSEAFLLGTFAIYVFLVPFVTGATCMAEERNWGVVTWQLTLPPPTGKQAGIKLAIAGLTCLILGVAIPLGLLIVGSRGFQIGKTEFVWDWRIAAQIYLAVFTLVIYASSVSRNALRAIITALGLIAVVGGIAAYLIFGIIPRLNNVWLPQIVFALEPGSSLDSLTDHLERLRHVGAKVISILFWLLTALVWFWTYRNVRMSEVNFAETISQFTGWLTRRWKPAAITLFIAGLAGYLAYEAVRFHDPKYKGKTFSQWAAGYIRPVPAESANSDEYVQRIKDSNEAIRYFLANSLPDMKWMAARRYELVFIALGQMGKSAQPMAAVLATNLTMPDEIGALSAGALANLGPKGVEILTNAAFRTTNFTVRTYIAQALGRYGELGGGLRHPGIRDLSEEEFAEGQEMATPVLLSMLDDSSPKIARMAAYSLAGFHRAPDRVVPRLVTFLKSAHGGDRGNVLHALAKYGEAAHSALPEVLQVLHDPDAWTGRAATNALKAIDPELAAKMGIK